MSLFQMLSPKELDPVKSLSSNHILLGYKGGNPPEIDSVKDISGRKDYQYYKDEHKDTLHLWVNKPFKDSVFFIARWKDTSIYKKIKLLPKHSVKDSLMLKLEKNSWPVSVDTLRVIANMPVVNIDEKACVLVDKDSQFIPLRANIINKHIIRLRVGSHKPGTYKLMFNSGAITGITGHKNDTLVMAFQAKKIEDYGSLELAVKTEKGSKGILQLLNKNKEEVIRQQYLSLPGEAVFTLLPPGEYRLRLLLDINGNKHWDTGDYFIQKQPEPVYDYSQTITIKPNWTVRQQIIFQ
jgi:hypothetical protein